MSQWGARGLAEKGLSAVADPEALLHRHRRPAQDAPGRDPRRPAAGARRDLHRGRRRVRPLRLGRHEAGEREGRRAVDASGRRGRSSRCSRPSATTPKFTSGVPVTVRYEARARRSRCRRRSTTYKRGRIDVDINAATGKTRAIIIVPFEQYLYGLGEMPSSWHHEALEAQAIAARTYALEKISRLGQARSVCNCAVYAIDGRPGVRGRRARGAALGRRRRRHEGTRRRRTAASRSRRTTRPRRAASPRTTRTSSAARRSRTCAACATPGDYFGGENPHANWKVAYDSAEVRSRLREAGYDTGTIKKISYLSPRGVSGRVIGVKDATHGGVLVDGTLERCAAVGQHVPLDPRTEVEPARAEHRRRHPAALRRAGLQAGPRRRGPRARGRTSTGRCADASRTSRTAGSSTTRRWRRCSTSRRSFLARYDAARAAGTDLGLPTADGKSITGGKLATFENGQHLRLVEVRRPRGDGRDPREVREERRTVEVGDADERRAAGTERRTVDALREGAHLLVVEGRCARASSARSSSGTRTLGGASGKLGMPTSDEYGISTGRRQDFTRRVHHVQRDDGADGLQADLTSVSAIPVARAACPPACSASSVGVGRPDVGRLEPHPREHLATTRTDGACRPR